MDENRHHDRPHWSASQLNQFLNICSLQYFFERVARLEPECVSSHMVFGKAIHNAIGYFYTHMGRGQRVKPGELAQVFTEDWQMETELANAPVTYSNGDTCESLADRGRALSEFFAQEAREEHVLAVEERFEVPLLTPDGHVLEKPLLGYFDLVVRDEEGARTVVDFKTAARGYSEGKIGQDLQATCYCYAIAQLQEADSVLFRWDVLVKTKAPQLQHYYTTRSQDDYDRLAWLIQCVERAIHAEAFLPNLESFYCTGCGYRAACREWHRHAARAMVAVGRTT